MGDDFDAVMAEFYGGVRSGHGALFLAVCRGKVCIPGFSIKMHSRFSSSNMRPSNQRQRD